MKTDNAKSARHFMRASRIAWLAVAGFALAAHPQDALAQAAPLDLSQYRLSFDDEFTKMDITAHGPGSVWTAHTPWHGDFGDAAFDDPGPNGPFRITPGGLTITAHKDPQGNWHSGLICSVDKDGPGQHGFAQEYGYFEMDAKFPGGPGTWPAFWLIGTDKSKTASEIDVIEYYGQFNRYFHSTEHVWANGGHKFLAAHMAQVPAGSLTAGFNTYGVLITPDRTVFYLNRLPIWSTQTPPEYQQKFYILANLALGGGWPTAGLGSPAVMVIKYIRVYQSQP